MKSTKLRIKGTSLGDLQTDIWNHRKPRLIYLTLSNSKFETDIRGMENCHMVKQFAQ